MKFGKLAEIENVLFDLPPDPSFNQHTFDRLVGDSANAQLYIGCTGWSMKEWVGTVYPAKTKTKDFLQAYSRQFNTIELNTTHYRIPTSSMIEKWYKESRADFKFCPKLPQTISHSKNLGLGSGRIEAFCAAISGLQEKLGYCFIQLPPYFGLDRANLLRQFLANFPSDIPLAIELRHESWFKNETATATFLELCAEFNRATVITDVAGRRDVLHLGITNDTVLIRLVGNGLHPTDYGRVDDWIDRMKSWYDKGLKNVYLFPHEPDNILAPQLAAYVHLEAQEKLNVQTRGPKLIAPDEGKQISLF